MPLRVPLQSAKSMRTQSVCLPPKKALSLPSVSRSDAPVEASACKAASISCFSAALTIDLFSRNVGRMATPPSRPRSA
ncbi:MAG: hypothetical protein ACLS7Z_12915 [Christensenellales bacterium]